MSQYLLINHIYIYIGSSSQEDTKIQTQEHARDTEYIGEIKTLKRQSRRHRLLIWDSVAWMGVLY